MQLEWVSVPRFSLGGAYLPAHWTVDVLQDVVPPSSLHAPVGPPCVCLPNDSASCVSGEDGVRPDSPLPGPGSQPAETSTVIHHADVDACGEEHWFPQSIIRASYLPPLGTHRCRSSSPPTSSHVWTWTHQGEDDDDKDDDDDKNRRDEEEEQEEETTDGSDRRSLSGDSEESDGTSLSSEGSSSALRFPPSLLYPVTSHDDDAAGGLRESIDTTHDETGLRPRAATLTRESTIYLIECWVPRQGGGRARGRKSLTDTDDTARVLEAALRAQMKRAYPPSDPSDVIDIRHHREGRQCETRTERTLATEDRAQSSSFTTSVQRHVAMTSPIVLEVKPETLSPEAATYVQLQSHQLFLCGVWVEAELQVVQSKPCATKRSSVIEWIEAPSSLPRTWLGLILRRTISRYAELRPPQRLLLPHQQPLSSRFKSSHTNTTTTTTAAAAAAAAAATTATTTTTTTTGRGSSIKPLNFFRTALLLSSPGRDTHTGHYHRCVSSPPPPNPQTTSTAAVGSGGGGAAALMKAGAHGDPHGGVFHSDGALRYRALGLLEVPYLSMLVGPPEVRLGPAHHWMNNQRCPESGIESGLPPSTTPPASSSSSSSNLSCSTFSSLFQTGWCAHPCLPYTTLAEIPARRSGLYGLKDNNNNNNNKNNKNNNNKEEEDETAVLWKDLTEQDVECIRVVLQSFSPHYLLAAAQLDVPVQPSRVPPSTGVSPRPINQRHCRCHHHHHNNNNNNTDNKTNEENNDTCHKATVSMKAEQKQMPSFPMMLYVARYPLGDPNAHNKNKNKNNCNSASYRGHVPMGLDPRSVAGMTPHTLANAASTALTWCRSLREYISKPGQRRMAPCLTSSPLSISCPCGTEPPYRASRYSSLVQRVESHLRHALKHVGSPTAPGAANLSTASAPVRYRLVEYDEEESLASLNLSGWVDVGDESAGGPAPRVIPRRGTTYAIVREGKEKEAEKEDTPGERRSGWKKKKNTNREGMTGDEPHKNHHLNSSNKSQEKEEDEEEEEEFDVAVVLLLRVLTPVLGSRDAIVLLAAPLAQDVHPLRDARIGSRKICGSAREREKGCDSSPRPVARGVWSSCMERTAAEILRACTVHLPTAEVWSPLSVRAGGGDVVLQHRHHHRAWQTGGSDPNGDVSEKTADEMIEDTFSAGSVAAPVVVLYRQEQLVLALVHHHHHYNKNNNKNDKDNDNNNNIVCHEGLSSFSSQLSPALCVLPTPSESFTTLGSLTVYRTFASAMTGGGAGFFHCRVAAVCTLLEEGRSPKEYVDYTLSLAQYDLEALAAAAAPSPNASHPNAATPARGDEENSSRPMDSIHPDALLHACSNGYYLIEERLASARLTPSAAGSTGTASTHRGAGAGSRRRSTTLADFAFTASSSRRGAGPAVLPLSLESTAASGAWYSVRVDHPSSSALPPSSAPLPLEENAQQMCDFGGWTGERLLLVRSCGVNALLVVQVNLRRTGATQMMSMLKDAVVDWIVNDVLGSRCPAVD